MSEKCDQRRTIMVRSTIAKDQFTDPDDIFKEIVIIARSFHDKFHIGPMGMNTKFKVDSHFFNA